MKKSKNCPHFVNIDHTENFKLPTPLQSLGLQLSECEQKQNISVGHYETIEKWPPFHKYWSYGKFQITNPPPKFWSPIFQTCINRNGISVLAIMKWSKRLPFCKYQLYERISNYQPSPKVCISSFPSVDRNGILVSAFMEKLKNGHHFVNICNMAAIS